MWGCSLNGLVQTFIFAAIPFSWALQGFSKDMGHEATQERPVAAPPEEVIPRPQPFLLSETLAFSLKKVLDCKNTIIPICTIFVAISFSIFIFVVLTVSVKIAQ